MLDSRRARLTFGLAVAAVAVMRFLARARVPDDYDAIGFVQAVTRYDLPRLQPHFPGYPVYVALARAVAAALAPVAAAIAPAALGAAPLAAATLVSALAAAATAAALFRLGARAAGDDRGGWFALALYAAAWLPWLAGGAALSDGTATAFAMLAFAALTFPSRAGAVAAGACVALMLGTRASYWPLALSFAWLARRHPHRRAVALAAAAGTLAWLVPFVAVVGARELMTLGRAHLTGHFTDWGGTVVTRPNLPLRVFAFARALLYDGLFANGLALAAALSLVVAVVVIARPRLPWKRALTVAAPYALWVLVAQNVIDQPRHLLPLVAGLCAFVAPLAARPLAAAALVALAFFPSLPLAIARATTAPAAAQAAAWAAKEFPLPDSAAFFGGRSIRFFQTMTPWLPSRPRTWLSEVDVELERLNVLPRSIYVTSEVELNHARDGRVGDGPTFCRDARIDRAQPCLSLRAYRLIWRR